MTDSTDPQRGTGGDSTERGGGPKVIVVGIDGAGWDLLDPWLAAGELPTLAGIIEDGLSGTLRPVFPPVTSPNWKAYATGKNPGKLGIFWWKNVDVEGERIYAPTDRYHDHPAFWELLAQREPVGVLGVPLTYPPTDLEAFLVAGAPDAEEKGYANPPSVEAELRDRFDYRINSQYRRTKEPEQANEHEIDIVDSRFRAAKHLLAEHDLSFLQVSTFYINQFHHYRWDDEYTLRAWKVIDSHLADLLDAGHNLVVMSDHGHNEIGSVFRVNQWLAEEGYLTLERSIASTMFSLGIDKERIKTVLARLDRAIPVEANLVNLGDKYAPQWLLKHLPNDEGEVGSRTEVPAVWEETQAIASAQGPVYLTLERSSPRYHDLRDELKVRLESLTDERGNPVADAVHYSEEVYAGEYLDEAPDLLIDQAENVHIREYIGDKPVFSDTDPKWRGVNNRNGLFAATGPAFGSGTVDELSILDLAPTILSLYGVPVPEDMDGRVRHSVLSPAVSGD